MKMPTSSCEVGAAGSFGAAAQNSGAVRHCWCSRPDRFILFCWGEAEMMGTGTGASTTDFFGNG
jgi:hypothetical protein